MTRPEMLAANTCAWCSRTTRDTYICHPCLDTTRKTLILTADLARAADEKRARLGTTWRFGTIGRSPEAPLPYDPRITPVMQALTRALHRAVDHVMEHGRPTVLVADRPAAQALWLGSNLAVLAAHPDGPGLLDDVARAHHRLVSVFDRPPDKIYVGRCNDDGCTESLYADRDHVATVVACRRCGSEHPIDERREELKAGVQEYLGTVRETSRLLRQTFGDDVSERTIRGLRDHGLLVARGHRVELDAQGRRREVMTFRIGDVIDAVAAMRQDKEVRRGVRKRARETA